MDMAKRAEHVQRLVVSSIADLMTLGARRKRLEQALMECDKAATAAEGKLTGVAEVFLAETKFAGSGEGKGIMGAYHGNFRGINQAVQESLRERQDVQVANPTADQESNGDGKTAPAKKALARAKAPAKRKSAPRRS